MQMANYEKQKAHPFGMGEKRFEWTKFFSNGNDLKKHKRKINRSIDNLEGGIGKFLSRNRVENDKEQKTAFLLNNYNKFANRNRNRNKLIKYLSLNSQRVIEPEKDTEIKKPNKKRTYRSQEKNLLHSSGGRITSLLNKTPLKYEYKGRKTFYNSVDYGIKKDTDYFSDEFLNDRKYNRIPGVKRKHISHKLNLETKPLEGRKRYLCYNNQIIFC